MRNKNILYLTCVAAIICLPATAQMPDSFSQGPAAFRSTININTPTTTFLKKYGFEFHIRHRFGKLTPDDAIIKDFLGMDLTANIQFGFAVPLGNKTMVGVNRTKSGKTYGLNFKRAILTQSQDHSMPVSLSFFSEANIRTNEFSKVAPNTYFEDGTPFENKFNHRLIYNNKIIVSRKFGDMISIQLSPGVIYRNLVPLNEENLTGAIPLSGVIKTGMFSSFLFEYAYLLNHKTENNLHPVSIGYEFGTAGHVFQITVSSSPELNEADLYSTGSSDYDKGELYLGFNIKRTFWHKKRMQKILLKQQTK